KLKELLLRPSKIDIDSMRFGVDELEISGFSGLVITDSSYLPPEPEDTTATADFQLSMDKLSLNTIRFRFESRTSPMEFDVQLQDLKGKLRHFGLLEERIDLEQLQLENVTSSVTFGKTMAVTATEEEEEDSDDSTDWQVLADDLLLKNISFRYDDHNEPKLSRGMDYSHLNFTELYLNAADLNYQLDSISGNLKHLSVKEQSGLNLIELRSRFVYTDQGAQLQDFLLLTPNTHLADLLEVHYPSLETLQKDPGKMKINMVLQPGRLSMKDVFLFLPDDQHQQLQAYESETFKLQGKIK